jgi:hypothetical protein
MPQLLVKVLSIYFYTPLRKRGARGDFPSIFLKSPFYPPLPKGDKKTITEGLPPHVMPYIVIPPSTAIIWPVT